VWMTLLPGLAWWRGRLSRWRVVDFLSFGERQLRAARLCRRAAAALPRVCVSAVSGLYPCRLRACGAARSLPCADHAAHQLLRAEGLREAVQHRTAARSDGGLGPQAGRAVVMVVWETVCGADPLWFDKPFRAARLQSARRRRLSRSLRSLQCVTPGGRRSGITAAARLPLRGLIPFA
jgi:hypothetical protein